MESPVDDHAFTPDPQKQKPRVMPDDLPTSLDDRRHVPIIAEETEMYDAWQGEQRQPAPMQHNPDETTL